MKNYTDPDKITFFGPQDKKLQQFQNAIFARFAGPKSDFGGLDKTLTKV